MSDISTIQSLLDRLDQMQAQRAAMSAYFDKLRSDFIPPDIAQKLEEIDAEEKTAMVTMDGGIDEITAEIKSLTAAQGMSVKAAHLQAVWSRGRITWNDDALMGYAAAHPEIEAWRKVGEPSVSIRAVK